MRIVARLLSFVVALAGIAGAVAAQEPRAESLRLHGSNTVGQKLAPALVEAWAHARGWSVTSRASTGPEQVEIAITRADAAPLRVEIHAHGTGTGLADLVARKADVWMASRPAKPEEIDAASVAKLGTLDDARQEHVIALDGLAIIVHPRNPITTLTVTQLRDVFSGRVRDWSQLGGEGGAIAINARDDRSGTFDTFKSMVLVDAALDASARRYESTDALAAAVATDPNGLGFVGLSGVTSGVKVLRIADTGTRALAPSRLDVGTEDYVLARRLYLYNADDASGLVRAFTDFALSAAGQQVVEKIGFVSLAIVPFDVAPRGDVSPDYARFTQGARRLSLNFRFGSGQSWLDSRALRDLDRLAGYLAGHARDGTDLMLLGFVDGRETNPYVAISLANDRVDYIARLLAERGVGARRVRGMGAMAPVASNENAPGRARNRRVEVWVRRRDAVTATIARNAGG